MGFYGIYTNECVNFYKFHESQCFSNRDPNIYWRIKWGQLNKVYIIHNYSFFLAEALYAYDSDKDHYLKSSPSAFNCICLIKSYL